MVLTRGFTDDIKLLYANETLGAVEDELLITTLDRIGKAINIPLKISASFPVADAFLNIEPSIIEDGDGGAKSVSSINALIPPQTVKTTIDFQTAATTGQTVLRDSSSFTLPTSTLGYYRRAAFILRSNGDIDSHFSAEASSISGLTNPGTLFETLTSASSGLPIGWIDLECDNALGSYRTAGSTSSVIENKAGSAFRIYRFGMGSGGDFKATVDAETSARMAADSSLQANINQETTARQQADSTLQTSLLAETTSRLTSDSSLQSQINTEITNRLAADSTLQSLINSEISARLAVDSTLQSNINVEESARKASDTSILNAIDAIDSTLLNAIDSEASLRIAADSTLQSNINAEITARQQADITLASNLNLEGLARSNADSTLQSNINIETTARTLADSTLQSQIDAEVTARSLADVTLQNNISAETTARDLADSTLQANINSETTARTVADSSLLSLINNETTSREQADSTLQSNINTEITVRLNADSTLQANINAEATARLGADSSLQSAIQALDVTAFNFKSIVGENLTVNKGYMVLAGDGRELYAASDIVCDLTSLAADGDYYGYIDLNSLGLPTTINGRKVITIDDSNFYFSTTTPDAINLEIYYPQGLVRRVSGAWLSPLTLAFKRHASGGSGGDSSFRISSVAADGTIIVKGGYIALNYDAIMATYDGSGTTETDFGKDLTFDLDTLTTPSTGTTYYLYVDIYSLPAEVTLTDSGRSLIPVTASNFVLLTQDFEAVYQFRYAKIGVVRYETGAWSTTVAISYPQKKQIYPSTVVSPMCFLLEQVIGNTGDVSQISAGHALASSSFPSTHYATKVSFYNLTDENDGNTSLAHNLTNNGSTLFNGTGILGVASSCAVFNGISQWLSSTSSYFNPNGATDWVMGGWFKPTSYTPAANQTLFSSWASGGNYKFSVDLTTLGNLLISSSVNGTVATSTTIPWGTGSGWNHIAIKYDANDQDIYIYINSVNVGIHPVGAALYMPASPDFAIGARAGGSSYYAGLVDEFFSCVGYGLNDSEIAKIFAAKISHTNSPLTPKCQEWIATVTLSQMTVPLEEDFIVAMDENDLYVDLSGQTSTATIYLTMHSKSISGNTSVSVSRMFETTAGTIDSWGTFSHKLPAVPTVTALLVDVGSGFYEYHDASAYFKASSTQLSPVGGSNLSAILGASTNVQLLVSVGPAAIYSPPDTALTTSINNEITARINADSTLQANINSEITARILADSTLQTNINTEITARSSADSTLQSSLNAEITARILADSTLQANIDAIGGRQIVNVDTNASNNSILHVDTTSASKTITLPATPSVGWSVTVADAKNSFATNTCLIARNGSNISGADTDFTCDISGKIYTLVYIDVTYGWEVYL